MKTFLAMAVLFLAPSAALADDKFWAQLTPEERAAAGLADLTPAQREALDKLADRFAKEGAQKAVAVVQAEVKQKKAANAGLLVRDDDEAVSTHIDGPFRGWTGRTSFRLGNGQVWEQVDKSERFYVAERLNPEVELRPSKIGGWKLFLPSVDRWVRVRRVR